MASLLGIQILGALFGLFMAYYIFLHYKRKELTVREYGFWIFFWVAFILITIFPQILDPLVETLNISRTLDLLIIAGILFLVFVSIYNYSLLRKNQERLEKVVRSLAIRKK